MSIEAKVQQGADEHVAADSAEQIQIKRPHLMFLFLEVGQVHGKPRFAIAHEMGP